MSFWKKLVDTKVIDKEFHESAPEAQYSPSTSPTGPLTPEEHINQRFGKIRSALGPGTIIQGKLSFDTAVRIDGKLSGEIFSSKTLIVGPQAQISAEIEASALIVMGKFTGNVRAAECVEIWSGADFDGSVKSPSLSIQEGARFNATSTMVGSSQSSHASKTQSENKQSEDNKPNTQGGSSELKNPTNKVPVSESKTGGDAPQQTSITGLH